MPTILKNLLIALAFLVGGSLLALHLVPGEWEQMKWEVPGMPDSYPFEQKCRPFLLLLLCYIPFIGSVFYAFMGTMDRYMSRCYINYFLLCTSILLLIYMLADFTDNMERFRTRFDDPLTQALAFYASQLPMFLYQILPYTLMMGTLWCLSKLSGTSELTGMLQSGRSLLRVCMPVFLYAALGATAYGIFGFHWAPNGSLYRQIMLKQERLADNSAPPIIYSSDTYARMWRIKRPASFENPGLPMRQVVIEQFKNDSRGALVCQYIAESATWNKEAATWTLRNAYVRRMAPANVRPPDEEFVAEMECDFGEKPYQIISPSQNNNIDAMGTSVLYELIKTGAGSREDRFRYRTEWHVRLARIFSCLVLVLLALPSAITFQRRSPMKGIGIAVLLAALMLFLYRVFPSLGDSGLVQAWISAWIPNAIYLCIACYLIRKNLAHRSPKEWLQAKLHGRP
ncbi:MAG: LptF/LptG family permease [Akkermansiaceae bacterium]|nr:LptF/LptG family permease [Akkermansiaceae bacterium]